MKILAANPAGNITVFVLECVHGNEERKAIAAAIMADKNLGAEQVGFVFPPGTWIHSNDDGDNAVTDNDESDGGYCGIGGKRRSALWHLEMSGGEFCGNAARSFALYVARIEGLKGQVKIDISISGVEWPITAEVELSKNWASAEMPKPHAFASLQLQMPASSPSSPERRELPLIVFSGIAHVIAPDIAPGEGIFHRIEAIVERDFPGLPALGVMFYETGTRFMRPLVYVRSTGSLVYESSCGSGSAALGVWLSRELCDGSFRCAINQSGGTIETLVQKEAGEIAGISIGGKVLLGEPLDLLLP